MDDNNFVTVAKDYLMNLEQKAKDSEYFRGRVDGMEYVIDAQPTIDAVSVVRCKDCRFGTWDEDVEMYDCVVIDGCWFEAHHYCSYGERKESE